MYCTYYGLKEEPFSITPDPSFLYMSKKHEDALLNLLYGIKTQKGFMELTGEIGSGKTTICRAILEKLGDTVPSSIIINPNLSGVQLLATIVEDFGIEVKKKNKKSYFDALNRFIMDAANGGSTTVLIIDEAQDLKPATLEQIRLLSNFETNKRKLLQIIIMGQPELREMLAKPSLAPIRQRIAVSAHLSRLDRQQTEEYIAHRLKVAGSDSMLIFDASAIDKVYEYSNGIPRLINVICDKTLFLTYMNKTGQTLNDIDISFDDGASAQVKHPGPQAQTPETQGQIPEMQTPHPEIQT